MSKIIQKTATAEELQNEVSERARAVNEVNRKINILQNNLTKTREKLETDISKQIDDILSDIKNEQEKLTKDQFKLARVFQYLKENRNLNPIIFKTGSGVFISYFDGMQIKTVLVDENIPKINYYKILHEDSKEIIFRNLFKKYRLNKYETTISEIHNKLYN